MTEKEMGWPRRNQLDYRPGDERIIEIELERLRDFKNHPFRITDDEQMQELIESITMVFIHFLLLNINTVIINLTSSSWDNIKYVSDNSVQSILKIYCYSYIM